MANSDTTLHVFSIPDPMGGGMAYITSIVTTQDDFDNLMDTLDSMPTVNSMSKRGEFSKKKPDTSTFRMLRHVPVVARGSHTEWVFERYGVETPYLSVIVRGAGASLANRMLGSMISQMGERV
jgi:hypothetical protein